MKDKVDGNATRVEAAGMKFIPLVIDGMGRMCKEFLAFQKQVAMKQTRRYDSYYVGGLSEKDAAAYVAKIKRYNIARVQVLHRVWVARRAQQRPSRVNPRRSRCLLLPKYFLKSRKRK